ncbi:MAG: flagellar hook-basal body complex protein, partial [Selenomonadaceae bacterium]|nr:flagellar hook-basal body complex protein [Selenomonadaceae bacterium]
MMRSLFSGVSGLKVHQTRMDVIGNNIANVNTIGFKSSRTTFSDMLSQVQRSASAPTDGRGGTNPRQIGLGVDVESIDLVFTDSSPQQTGKNTDLALSGNGLFVLRDGNQAFYTRNGAFMFDESGYYVMPGNGLRVQGWNASDDGVINTNGTATDIIVPVGKTMEATATSTIDYTGNLNKESLLISSISYVTATGVTAADVMTAGGEHNVGTLDTDGNVESINVDGTNVIAATLTMKDGSTMHVTSGYYEVGHTVPITTLATVYDSLG